MSSVPGPPPPLDRPSRRALTAVGKQVKPLSRPSWAPLLAALSEWSVLAVAVGSTFFIRHPLWWIGVAVLVGARQHGLLVLMHEGVHRRFHPSAPINDLLSDVLCAWPMGVSTDGYRDGHLRHHIHLHTPADPDWHMRQDRAEWGFPLPLHTVLGNLAWMGMGGGLFAFFRSNARLKELGTTMTVADRHWARFLLRVAVSAALPLGALVLGEGWRWLGLWVLPMLTVLPVLVRFRVIAEHYGLPATHALDTTRDWTAGPVLNWLLVPWNIRLHLSHHLFPGVPFHNLPVVSAALRSDPVLGPRIHVTPGVRGLMRDLTGASTRG